MPKYYGWGLPFDASANGAAIDRLILIMHIFMAVLFVGWMTYLIVALLKFRSRPGHTPTYKTQHFKATTYIEVAVALFEAVILVGFAFPIFNHFRTELPPKDKAFEVRVVAEQFAWNIHYPGPDKTFGKVDPKLMGAGNPVGLDRSDPPAQDDVVAINQLHVPVNQPVIAHLSSKDVIHSFFLPVMRVKHDVTPGQTIPVSFEAVKTGKFEIACAQLCGLGHYRMRGFFLIDTPGELQTWFSKQVKKV